MTGTIRPVKGQTGSAGLSAARLKYLDPKDSLGRNLKTAKAQRGADGVLCGRGVAAMNGIFKKDEICCPSLPQPQGSACGSAYGLVSGDRYRLGDKINLPKSAAENIAADDPPLYSPHHDSNVSLMPSKVTLPFCLKESRDAPQKTVPSKKPAELPKTTSAKSPCEHLLALMFGDCAKKESEGALNRQGQLAAPFFYAVQCRSGYCHNRAIPAIIHLIYSYCKPCVSRQLHNNIMENRIWNTNVRQRSFARWVLRRTIRTSSARWSKRA